MENRVNNQPSRTKAKYGAVNGVYAPFFFSAVVEYRRVTPLYSPFGESASIADGWSPPKPSPAAAARCNSPFSSFCRKRQKFRFLGGCAFSPKSLGFSGTPN